MNRDDEKLDEADVDEIRVFISNQKQCAFFDNINLNNCNKKSKQKQLKNVISKPRVKSRSKQTKDQGQIGVNAGDDDEKCTSGSTRRLS